MKQNNKRKQESPHTNQKIPQFLSFIINMIRTNQPQRPHVREEHARSRNDHQKCQDPHHDLVLQREPAHEHQHHAKRREERRRVEKNEFEKIR